MAITLLVSSGGRRALLPVAGPLLRRQLRLLPLVMVLVELAEGPRLVGYLVRCRPEEVSFGMPVRVLFKRLTERVMLPVWEPIIRAPS